MATKKTAAVEEAPVVETASAEAPAESNVGLSVDFNAAVEAAVASALAKMEAEKKAAQVETPQPEPEKLVTIQLFKDSDRYKDDVSVILNGKCWQIQRGVPVDVPVGVAEIIRHSIEQDGRTADFITGKAKEFTDEAKKLGF